MIFVIKVTTNKEESAVDLITDKVNSKNLNIDSILKPHGLRGYILLEAEDRESAEEAVYNLPYVKGIIGKTLSYDEIKNMVETAAAPVTIKEGDIVEIISEPFKKEKAKVLRVDEQKGDVVVSLLGALVQLPVTIKIDNVRAISRDEQEEETDGY